jgi:Gram-negative porin
MLQIDNGVGPKQKICRCFVCLRPWVLVQYVQLPVLGVGVGSVSSQCFFLLFMEKFLMKKTLIALAALAATGAFAQSTVNITGIIGFGHQQQSSYTAAGARNAFNNSGFTNTDIGVTVAASEDLGGGLRASGSVTFDSTNGGFGNTGQGSTAGTIDKANALLVRNKSIGLSGGFGSISLANTRSSDLITRGMVAPTALPDGMYDSSGVIARAAVDAVTYTLPAMSGFAPYAQYVESGVDGSGNKLQRTYVVGGNYTSGPLTAAVAYKMNKNPGAAATPFKNNLEAFASYNLGVAVIGVGFDAKRSDAEEAATSFGVAVPMGALTLGANYASRKVGTVTNKVTELVAKYDLSRRTYVHLSWGDQTADENVALGVDGKQHRLGLVHTF